MNYLPKITVAIRKRPLSYQEIQRNDKDIVNVNPPCFLEVCELRHKVDMSKYIEKHQFQFDAAFGKDCTNEQLYQTLVQPLIMLAFDGSKVNCFAYGQTGSGKTYTMMGLSDQGISGLYLLAAQDVFQLIKQDEYNHLMVGISFYEIYCGKAYDLLNDREKCPIRVDSKENVNIVGLNEKLIQNKESLMALINYGQTVRKTGSTGMNDTSSRSHAILTINLRNQNNGKVQGKMTFIDLAGSERGADVTDTNKQTRQDGAEINKSLLALKECIRAMDQDKKHLPFRGSKLTLVLKDSFVGKCKTVMIGAISPGSSSCEHTLNTLRYADRVKELKKKNKKMSKQDKLSHQLMLPRLKQNSNLYEVKAPQNKSIIFSQFDAKKSQQDTKISFDQSKHNDKNQKKSNNFINKRLSNLSDNQASRQPLFKQNHQKTFLKQNQQKNFNNTNNNFEIEDSENEYYSENSFLRKISEQQDDLIEEHSKHIDNMVGCIKQDMNLLQNIKNQPTQMIEYIQVSNDLLDSKIQSIKEFKKKLELFQNQFQKLEQYEQQQQYLKNEQMQQEEEELFEIEEYKKEDGLLDGL